VLGSCLEESRRLAKIIDALLFLARAETPDLQIEREPVVITDELRAVQEFYEPIATEAGIALKLDAPERLIAELDRTLFQRALCNLTENALRYTPRHGRVALAAWRKDHTLYIVVSDTGSGIDAEHLPRIFDRFYRGDPARSPHSGGAGLGLALVKSIAALHSGSVKIESQPGRGTTVTISVPSAGPVTMKDERREVG
jgi:two-component system heavy metal sensor histidine kinase CusS